MFCQKCGCNIEDDSVFCPNCGNKIMGANNANGNLNQNQSQYMNQNAYTNSMQGGQVQRNGSGNNAAIIVAFVAIVVIVIGLVFVLFVLKPFGKNGTGNNGNNPNNVSNMATTETANNAGDDLKEYEDYYNSTKEVFGKLLVDDENLGKIDGFKDALNDALDSKNVENCKYNYDKLKELEDTLINKSEKKIDSLKDDLSSWEGKKSSKKAKKKTSYKKNKSLAKNELSNGNYKMAKTYYQACIDALKTAKKKADKKKKSSSKSSSSTNDDWYKTGATDDTTVIEVTNDYLDFYAVRAMSTEEKRYYINTLFAAYGYRFNNKTIQNFFDNQSWYEPDYGIAVGDQTAIIKMFDQYAEANYDFLRQ